MKNRIAPGITLLAVLVLSAAALLAQNPKTAKPAQKHAAKSTRVDISKDKVGGESSKFLSVVGNWSVVEDGGRKVYAVWMGANGCAAILRAAWPRMRARFMAQSTKTSLIT